MSKTLSQLNIGHTGKIREILTDHITKERLESLGIIKGLSITTVRETPLGCPRIYRALNTLVTLRNKLAKQIIIEEGDYHGEVQRNNRSINR